MAAANKFVIVREDLVQDPVTIVSEGLLIGRLHQCELLLNHPTVSRVQAGLKQIEGSYYVFNLRSSNPAILNGKPVEGNEALAPGDYLEIGPFTLDIDIQEGTLIAAVSLRIGIAAPDPDAGPALGTTSRLSEELAPPEKKKTKRPAPIAGNKALDIFWDKRIREAGKMVRPSPLFPKSQRRAGKAQYNWAPTTDLVSRWPASFFVWGTVLVGLLAVGAAYAFTNAYAPAPLSLAHSKSEMSQAQPIALRPNADSCTTCHSLSGNMDSRCSECHQTEIFNASMIEPHAAAGLRCATCHAEHRGPDFQPGEAALRTCTDCHNDGNTETYNGKRVGTAHGGTFGYPVLAGKWELRMNDTEWALKKIPVTRLATETDEEWSSKQFHALHVQRVKRVGQMPANADGNLSCSSCHKSFDPIDLQTPKTTCGNCHNGRTEPGTNRVLIASDKPNCTSCHIQHLKDQRHWGQSLLASR